MMRMIHSRKNPLYSTLYPRLMLVITFVLMLIIGVTLFIGQQLQFQGDIIAFVGRGAGSNLDIYTLTFDRNLPGMTRNLTHNFADDTAPIWSPDGARLAFVSEIDGRPNVYTMDVSGRNRQQLTHFRGVDDFVHMLAWSPDGTQLAFTSNFENQWHLYVMDSDGDHVRPLWDGVIITSPIDWSPDGTRIIFTANGATNQELFVLELATGNVRALTDDIHWDAAPNWSPDGTQIVYRSHRGGNFGIYVLDEADGTIARLTDRFSENFDPVWSPDASRILFLSRGARTPVTQLYLMNPDGSSPQRLFTGVRGDHYSPSWRP